MILKFHIPGEPIAKQSARHRIVTKKNGEQFISSYQTKAITTYHKKIATIVKSKLPSGFKRHDGKIMIKKAVFAFTPPKSLRAAQKKAIEDGITIAKTTTPDIDNLVKGLLDPMQGIVFTNDSRICGMDLVRKVYYKTPGIWIDIELIES